MRMVKYSSNISKGLPEDITTSVVTLAVDHLYNVRKTSFRLEEAAGRSFHRAAVRLLFLCKWSRPDIKNVVEFLTTRVKEPIGYY